VPLGKLPMLRRTLFCRRCNFNRYVATVLKAKTGQQQINKETFRVSLAVQLFYATSVSELTLLCFYSNFFEMFIFTSNKVFKFVVYNKEIHNAMKSMQQ
jgi:hypothetical protein